VLLELADELADRGVFPFDAELFRKDLDSEVAREAFRDDLKETRYREVGRFPTLILLANGGAGILLAGYRPYDVLRKALLYLAPQLAPRVDERLAEADEPRDPVGVGTRTTGNEVS
jgi:predicted DsbA family dithiol-disulfide isomerase